ncbi:hypothetical protein Tco_1331816 [Tanacetum coccineum]
MDSSSATWDERLEIVEVNVSSFVGISFKSLVHLPSVRQLQLQLLPFVVPANPSRTELIEPKPLTLEFEPILEMEDVVLKCMESLGAEFLGSDSAVKSAETSCADADLECN